MKPLLWVFQFAFGCHHQLSGVFTIQKRTYRVCLECGDDPVGQRPLRLNLHG